MLKKFIYKKCAKIVKGEFVQNERSTKKLIVKNKVENIREIERKPLKFQNLFQ